MDKITRYANFDSRIVSVKYIIDYSQKHNGFDLPKSQREKEWINDQNAKFIHSIFENKPLGSFIFNKRNNKTYILDGQHRINALEQFTKDNFGVKTQENIIYYTGKSLSARRIQSKTNKQIVELTDEEKREFLDTEIFIREYKDLTDDEMADIIDSINEGIVNTNVNKPTDINNDIVINKLYEECSKFLYNKSFLEIKSENKIDLRKYISYIGTIIQNFDSFEDSSNYKLLNIKHIEQFMKNLQKEKDIDLITNKINKFFKILFSNNLLTHADITRLTDKYDLNNNYINCFCYILYEKYEKYDECEKSDINKIDYTKIRKIFCELIEKYSGNYFKELLECFNMLYDN